MTLVQDWQRDIFGMVKFDEFLSNLKNCRIADMGRIEAIVDKGAYATVRLLDGSNQLLKAEVFGESVSSGQYCLLIIPATPFDVAMNGLDVAERSYASTHAKCFPLQSPTFSKVQFKHDIDTLSISTPSYTLQCDEQGIVALDSKGFSISLADGQFTLANNDGSIDVSITDTSVTINAGNTYSETGKASKTTITLDNEGKATLKLTSLKIEGDVEVTGNFSAANGNLTAEV